MCTLFGTTATSVEYKCSLPYHYNQGIFTLFAWFRGGCPLVGIREPEPEETITILGPPPNPTVRPTHPHPTPYTLHLTPNISVK